MGPVTFPDAKRYVGPLRSSPPEFPDPYTGQSQQANHSQPHRRSLRCCFQLVVADEERHAARRLWYALENMNKFFEPLFITKSRGIGLGLAISRNMVESNGGSIEVENGGLPGKGRTFTVARPTKMRAFWTLSTSLSTRIVWRK